MNFFRYTYICLLFCLSLFSCQEEQLSLEELQTQYLESSKNKEWRVAASILDKSILIDPNDPNSYYLRASVYSNFYERSNSVLILSDLDKSISLDSSMMEVYYLRFQTNFLLNYFENALKDIQKIIDTKGETPLLLSWKGNCAFAARKFDIAEKAYYKRLDYKGTPQDLKNNYYYWVFSKYFGGDKEGALWDVGFLEKRGLEKDDALFHALVNDEIVWEDLVRLFELSRFTVEEFYQATDTNNL